MEDIFKAIFQLEIDTSGAIDGLEKVNSKYRESNAELKKTQSEISKLMAREAELLAARKNANNPTSVVRYNAEIVKTQEQINRLKTSIAAVTKTEQDAAKGAKQFGDNLKQAFDATRATALNNEIKKTKNSFTDLRAQLKAAKGELQDAFSKGNQADIQRASERVGELQDKMRDLNEQTNAFASGSKFQTVSNLGRGVFGDLLNFDFDGANQKSKALLATTKAITFAEARKGVGDLGTTLLNIGRALLANPIVLLGAGIAAIVMNYDKLVGLFKEGKTEADRLTESIRAQAAAAREVTSAYDRHLALSQAIGAGDEELLNIQIEKGKKALEALQKEERALYQLMAVKERNGESTEEEMKQAEELQETIQNTLTETAASVLRLEKLRRDAAKRAAEDEKRRLKELAEFIKQQSEKGIDVSKARTIEEAREQARRIEQVRDSVVKRLELEEEFAQKSAEIDQRERDRDVEDALKVIEEHKAFLEAIAKGRAEDDALAAESRKGRTDRIRSQLLNELDADHAHNQSLLRQRNAANSESLFEQLDYEKKKLEIMKQYGKATEDEIRAQQDRINEIEGSAIRQRQLEVIGYYEQLSNAAIDGAQTVISAKQKEIDRLAKLQEKRVEDAEEIAEDGNAQALELERERLEQLNQQREAFARRQQTLSAIEMTANALIAISKAAAQGGAAAPITIAATLIALTAGIIQARTLAQQAAGSFYEGGYTGDGNPREESRALGRKSYTYHKGEFVFNHEKTGRYKDIFQDIHRGNIDLAEWQSKVKAYEQMRALSYVTHPNSTQDLDVLETKLDKVILAIEGQQTSVTLDSKGLSMRFKRIRSRGDFINKVNQ